jgi:hypothetical protein
MVNYENIFFSNANKYVFFFVILIEICILKTTVYHKYTFTKRKYKKKVKKRYYRPCAPFWAKHWRHLCAIPMLLFVICFST